MLVTNHVLCGAFVGRASSGMVRAFGYGVLSHVALDVIPHWGDGRPIEEMMHVAVPDGLLGLTAMGLVTWSTEPGARLRVLAGMAGAAFPDLDKPARRFFGRSPFPRLVDEFHAAIQTEYPTRMPQEILVGLAQAGMLVVLARRRDPSRWSSSERSERRRDPSRWSSSERSERRRDHAPYPLRGRPRTVGA